MLHTISTKQLETNGKFLVDLTEFIYDERYNIPLAYFLNFFFHLILFLDVIHSIYLTCLFKRVTQK